MLGVGGKRLADAPATVPVTASSVVTFATTVASSVISWCPMTPDYGVYHNEKASTYVSVRPTSLADDVAHSYPAAAYLSTPISDFLSQAYGSTRFNVQCTVTNTIN